MAERGEDLADAPDLIQVALGERDAHAVGRAGDDAAPGIGDEAVPEVVTLATLGTPYSDPAAACVVRADDGAIVRWIDGARTIALHPDGRKLLVGGEWGALWLEPPREAS